MQERKSSVLESVLNDIITGVVIFPIEDKLPSELIFDELKNRLGSKINSVLGKEEEEYFANMLREIDGLLWRTKAMIILLEKVQKEQVALFRDRRFRTTEIIQAFIKYFSET